MSDKTNRRTFLTLLAAGLAGCGQQKETTPSSTSEDNKSPEPQDTDTPTTTDNPTTETEEDWTHFKYQLTAENNPPIAAYKQPETDKVEEYNVPLEEAKQWHNQTYEWFKGRRPEIQTFFEGINNPEWLTQFEQELEEKYDTELNHKFTWQQFKDAEDYQSRVEDTGFNTLWYRFEQDRLGGISSTNNKLKAATWQAIWNRKLDSDTFLFPVQLGNHHGNGAAIDNPAQHRDQYDSQSLYEEALQSQTTHIIETGQQTGDHFNDQATEIKDADYLEPGTWEHGKYWHPARFGQDDTELSYKQQKDLVQTAFLGLAGIKPRGGSFGDNHTISHGFATEFSEWLRDPSTAPAQEYIDLAASYMALDQDHSEQATVLGSNGFYGVTQENVERIDNEKGQTYDLEELVS